jgi:hypothetical protein
MKNSFIIKNADASFDVYYHSTFKKRRTLQGNTSRDTNAELKGGLFKNRRPGARDGHSGLVYEGYYIVFGGDRHHMPFNDIYGLDLKTELAKL